MLNASNQRVWALGASNRSLADRIAELEAQVSDTEIKVAERDTAMAKERRAASEEKLNAENMKKLLITARKEYQELDKKTA